MAKYSYESYVKWYQSQAEKFPMATPLIPRDQFPKYMDLYKESTAPNQRSNLPRDLARSQRVVTRDRAIEMLKEIRESGKGESQFKTLKDIMQYRGETWTYTHANGETEIKTGTTKQALFMNYLEEVGREEANSLYGY